MPSKPESSHVNNDTYFNSSNKIGQLVHYAYSTSKSILYQRT